VDELIDENPESKNFVLLVERMKEIAGDINLDLADRDGIFGRNEKYATILQNAEVAYDLFRIHSEMRAYSQRLKDAARPIADLEFNNLRDAPAGEKVDSLIDQIHNGYGIKTYFGELFLRVKREIEGDRTVIQDAYEGACDRLKQMAAGYLKEGFVVEDRGALRETITNLDYLVPRIEAAKEFAGVIKQRRIITKAELSQLQELRSVVLEARDNMGDSDPISKFKSEMETAERYISSWGIDDWDVKRSVSSARKYLNESQSPQQRIPDPRVAPLFEGVPSINSVDSALLTKLEGWEQLIERL